jgi:protein-S-isoprenylcysteine O-methyltransferase Ste14
MLNQPYITLILLWIIFGIVHSGLASGIVTRAATRIMGKVAKYYRAIASLVVFITLLILIHYHFAAIDTILFRPHWIEKIIAAILVLSGVVIMVIYTWNYLISFSGLGVVFGIEVTAELQQTGLFAYVRHPMFAGAVVFIWGVFLGYPYMNNLVTAICLTIYSFIAVFFAERRLELLYGDMYKQYQRKVPVLFPGKFRA